MIVEKQKEQKVTLTPNDIEEKADTEGITTQGIRAETGVIRAAIEGTKERTGEEK